MPWHAKKNCLLGQHGAMFGVLTSLTLATGLGLATTQNFNALDVVGVLDGSRSAASQKANAVCRARNATRLKGAMMITHNPGSAGGGEKDSKAR